MVDDKKITYTRPPELKNILRDFKERFEIEIEQNPIFYVWLQEFPNTAGLFDDFGVVSGQAFTDYYVSVLRFCVNNYELYAVYQRESFVYAIEGPNKLFYKDLKDRNIKSLKNISKYKEQ